MEEGNKRWCSPEVPPGGQPFEGEVLICGAWMDPAVVRRIWPGLKRMRAVSCVGGGGGVPWGAAEGRRSLGGGGVAGWAEGAPVMGGAAGGRQGSGGAWYGGAPAARGEAGLRRRVVERGSGGAWRGGAPAAARGGSWRGALVGRCGGSVL